MSREIPPDIAARLTTPEMVIPEFKSHIKEEDLQDFGERDKKLLLAFSVLEQKIDFCIEWMKEANTHLRLVEATQIRSATFWVLAAKWIVMTATAGTLSALINFWIKHP